MRDDRGEWRPQIVRDVGEELRLERFTRPHVRDFRDGLPVQAFERGKPRLQARVRTRLR